MIGLNGSFGDANTAEEAWEAIFTVEPTVRLPLLPQAGGGLQRQAEARAGTVPQLHCSPCCKTEGLLRLGDGDEVADAMWQLLESPQDRIDLAPDGEGLRLSARLLWHPGLRALALQPPPGLAELGVDRSHARLPAREPPQLGEVLRPHLSEECNGSSPNRTFAGMSTWANCRTCACSCWEPDHPFVGVSTCTSCCFCGCCCAPGFLPIAAVAMAASAHGPALPEFDRGHLGGGNVPRPSASRGEFVCM